MGTIIAAINLVITAALGAVHIWKTAHGDGAVVDKVKSVRDDLAKIVSKIEKLAATTEPDWDDTLASALSASLEAVAGTLIEQLEA